MNPDPASDGALLEHFVRARDQGAFEEIVRRHQAVVFGVCLRVLGRRHDAEDATQAVFLTLAHKAKGLIGRESVAGWLHHAAWHVARRALRSAALRRELEREARRTEPRRQEAHPIAPLLDLELDALPEKYRLPLILHHLEGRSLDEAARRANCSLEALAKRLTRGRDMLRHKLARHGMAVSGGALAALMAHLAAPAALPSAFAASTAKAAALVATGHVAAGVVSAQVGGFFKGGLHAMSLAKMKIAAAFVAISVTATGGGVMAYRALEAAPQEQPTRTAKAERLSRERMEKLHGLIKPHAGEWKWAQVPWMSDLAAARKKAAAEDKPLYVWTMAGEPLGHN